ncbi:hypothetical protein E8L90_17395 [Brevibacillus antibioticus]|uniref:Uncharacterized protein n=1 Tax=Brevibacillus antibioticus TaxID=2570228 RepID=A0A4U2Y8V0_9BACL|nr:MULTISPECIES: HEPN domain-containing protein [Bacillales]TKI57096.1 hypothetical protein E8L90_17395 [Brevibacillus antibioticus]TQR38515.1 hypothetical protein C7Y45_00125 [Lysinibacillus sp. SDF0063]
MTPDMYYARLVFFVTNDYDLDIEEEQCLFQTDSIVCKVKIDRRMENVKVIFSYGAFSTEEIAKQEGEKLFYNVKKEFIRRGIPINISGGLRILDTLQTSFDTGGLTKVGLANIHLRIPELVNTTVENETLGLRIYQLDKEISEVKFISQSIQLKVKVKFPDIKLEDFKDNEKLKIAYSLLNSSNAINDIRASFLLKVSSIESLVPEDEYKDTNYCDVINQINKMITMKNIKVELPDNELEGIIQKVKGSVGALKKKSIGDKCRDLIQHCNIQKQYKNMDVFAFFNDCYKLRSEFVHTGTFRNEDDETKKIRNMEIYLSELNSLVLDILDYYEKNII